MKKAKLTIKVQCVICKHRWEVDPSKEKDPACPKCLGPVIALSAKATMRRA